MNLLGKAKEVDYILPGIGQGVTNCKLRRISPVTGKQNLRGFKVSIQVGARKKQSIKTQPNEDITQGEWFHPDNQLERKLK